MKGRNALTLPSDQANEVIRRRRSTNVAAERIASRRRRDAVAGVTKEGWLPTRAFEALILFYEKVAGPEVEGEADRERCMADLLRLDLDRFTRNELAREQARWGWKDKAG